MRPHYSPVTALFLCVIAGCGGSGSTAPTTTLLISVPTNSLPSGSSVQATASIKSSGGTSAASDVMWSSSNSAIASVSGSGVITGTLAGASTIRATSSGMIAEVRITVVPGDPAAVTIYLGNGQTGLAGSLLPDPLCTNVKDTAGNSIIGALVTYNVMTGGGSIAEPTQPRTAADGIARSGLWRLGSTAGTHTVVASSPGATSVTFTATAR
jgi:Bacterial Ig-like domain (group 2)